MSAPREIVVTLPGGRRVDATVGRHTVHTDQPAGNGGADSAPTPFELFLTAIGTCAGIFVQGFCAARGIASETIRIIERAAYDERGLLHAVDLEIELPADFPERYRAPLMKAVEQCSVKRAIAAQPFFTVQTRLRGQNAHAA
jgi:ribosomal protein S12 methylthiotransferase accessory factor